MIAQIKLHSKHIVSCNANLVFTSLSLYISTKGTEYNSNCCPPSTSVSWLAPAAVWRGGERDGRGSRALPSMISGVHCQVAAPRCRRGARCFEACWVSCRGGWLGRHRRRVSVCGQLSDQSVSNYLSTVGRTCRQH